MMKMEVTHRKHRAPNALNMIVYLYGEMAKFMPSDKHTQQGAMYKDSGSHEFFAYLKLGHNAC